MKLTKEKRIAKHKDFLNANWRLLASFSWGNYLEKGRGLVMVPEEDFVHADRPKLAGIRFFYAQASSPELTAIPEWTGGKEEGWLSSYDPEQKVIVLVMRPEEGTSGYLIGARPSPPECHAMEQAKAN